MQKKSQIIYSLRKMAKYTILVTIQVNIWWKKQFRKRFRSYPRPTLMTEEIVSTWEALIKLYIKWAKENKNMKAETGIKNSKEKNVLSLKFLSVKNLWPNLVKVSFPVSQLRKQIKKLWERLILAAPLREDTLHLRQGYPSILIVNNIFITFTL